MLEVNSENNGCTSVKNNSSTNSLRKLVKNPLPQLRAMAALLVERSLFI